MPTISAEQSWTGRIAFTMHAQKLEHQHKVVNVTCFMSFIEENLLCAMATSFASNEELRNQLI
jgi:CMP-2-keto-3-deoxyoctulosonic acid synthetase